MLALAIACCATPSQQSDDGDGPIGTTSTKQALVTAAVGQWAWNDVPGSHCGNGQQTGFAVNLGTSNEVFMFMAGGGACWDELTCNISLPGIGPTAYHFKDGFDANTFWNVDWFHRTEMFDRTSANNPYKNATFIYIPYCTGDFHTGSTTQWFAQAQKTAYFSGRQNLDLYLNMLAADPIIQNASHMTLAGTSAGAFGATINYEHIRQAFGNRRLDLVADSGPYLYNNAFLFSGFGTWHLWDTVPTGCTNCGANLRNIYSYYDNKFTDSRFAFLSNDMDIAISTAYPQLFYPQFYYSMVDFAGTTIQPLLRTRFFIPDATPHGLLDKGLTQAAQPRKCNTGILGLCNPVNNGTAKQLGSWLNDMTTDSPTWSNVTGMIMAQCTPNCSGNQCGADGCGGVCGNCGTNMACTPSNQCLYTKGCTINGVNYDAGAINPAMSCQVCDPSNPFAWSILANNCFINGQCKSEGARENDTGAGCVVPGNGTISCTACQPSVSKTSWTSQQVLGSPSAGTQVESNVNGQVWYTQAQQYSVTGIVQSLSYYVKTAAGTLRLGIYDYNGSGPGNLVAQTEEFTPVVGWNTRKVISPVRLPAGVYFLAYFATSSSFQGAFNTSRGGPFEVAQVWTSTAGLPTSATLPTQITANNYRPFQSPSIYTTFVGATN